MDKDEEVLIRKAQRGNLQAFESLVYRYDVQITRLIFNMVNNIEDTHDLYQEVFVKVFKSIKSFRFQSEFYTWLFRIAINACINFRKHKKSRHDDSLEEYIDSKPDNWKIFKNDWNPEQQLLNTELGSKIQQSIDLLSSKQKTVFTLRHYHGYKLNEIANMMNCSEGTIKNYMFRAVQKLKNSLKEYYQT